jgi:hypothetical protein
VPVPALAVPVLPVVVEPLRDPVLEVEWLVLVADSPAASLAPASAALPVEPLVPQPTGTAPAAISPNPMKQKRNRMRRIVMAVA